MGRSKKGWFSLEDEMKECSICNRRLPFDNFHIRNEVKSGRFPYCKDCDREKNGHVKKVDIYGDVEKKLKQCSMCMEILEWKCFSKNYNCMYGINSECKECRRIKRGSKYRNSFIDSENGRRECTKCRKLLDFSKFTKNSCMKAGVHTQCIKCVAENRKSEKYRKYVSSYTSRRLKTDINFRLKFMLRGRVYKALKGGAKPASLTKSLGCSIPELKVYLESKFYNRKETGEKMSWDNYGSRGWHVDHFYPLASFNLVNKEEFLKATHYTNLQPLWAEDNYAKGAKIL